MKKPFHYNKCNESISRACAIAAHSSFHPHPLLGRPINPESSIVGSLQVAFQHVEGTDFDADGWLESISSEGQSLLESIKLTTAGELARTFETICYATARPFIKDLNESAPANDNNEAQYLLNNKMVSDLPNKRSSMITSRALRVEYDFKLPIFYYDPLSCEIPDPIIDYDTQIHLLPWTIGKGCEVDAMRSGLQIIQEVQVGCLIGEAMMGCFGYMDCPPSVPLGHFQSPFEGTLWYIYQDIEENKDTKEWLAELRKNDTI